MLSVNTYEPEYVAACRASVEKQISAYRDLAAVAPGPQLDAFAPLFFNNMILALDERFLHRSRNLELKDGNPLNEVRVVCQSIMANDAVLQADKTIRLKPDASVLGYAAGDQIRLDERDFTRLADAFFAEIECKYA